MVQEYEVEIKKTLTRIEKVRAENLGDAIDIAMEKYYAEEIVLDAEDMKGVDFTPCTRDKGR